MAQKVQTLLIDDLDGGKPRARSASGLTVPSMRST